jgi:hypothetical protein
MLLVLFVVFFSPYTKRLHNTSKRLATTRFLFFQLLVFFRAVLPNWCNSEMSINNQIVNICLQL